MTRRIGWVMVGSALAVSLGIAACVSDEKVDLESLNDPTTNGTADAGPEIRPPLTFPEGGAPDESACDSLAENTFPTCPTLGPDDVTCSDPAQNCCPGLPGNACTAETTCQRARPLFQCFAPAHCAAGSGCCTKVALEPVPAAAAAGRTCGAARALVMRDEGTSCECPAGGATTLCRVNQDCASVKAAPRCEFFPIVISLAGDDKLVRRVGVCVP